jgi:hypothetical protein
VHAPLKRFHGDVKDTDTADQAALLSEMKNRNAAFQFYPVHTGPGSKPELCHVKPINRNMEETFTREFLLLHLIPQQVGKSQIYYVNAASESYRYYQFLRQLLGVVASDLIILVVGRERDLRPFRPAIR